MSTASDQPTPQDHQGSATADSPRGRSIDRQIAAYALPSLATLLVEPLMVAADTAMVGHVGTTPLAGLSLASTILTTVVGMCIFLTYATTASTATLVGAGDRREAAHRGIEGLWLGAAIGAVLALVLWVAADGVIGTFGAEAATALAARAYLRTSLLGLPGMLLVLSATGMLRGFGDTQRPLRGATAGAILNVPLNAALIYGAHMGVAGAGLGTAIAQTAVAAYLTAACIRLARANGAGLRPSHSGVLAALNDAWPLIIRTLCLRIAILEQIAAATSLGTVPLAANQIVMVVWNFAAYGLDSIATAAQILVATERGAGGANSRTILARCLRFGLVTGLVTGAVVAALAWPLPTLMGAEADVASSARVGMLVAAACVPIASVAYILDGVLIGARDTRRLAMYMLLSLAVFTPLALLTSSAGFAWLWAAYAGVFMAVRAATAFLRSLSIGTR